ncbi:SAM-dependent methyltransferase [Streptomyces sp. CB03234]|uniref:class I SAM-dependent methyltransferase n=1 Tax=Streptomyces sp. (strain CB03234) TaxID=1703937 RepID=UPI00093EDCAC|nr:class I SAM-dependent methyltransferase [Streptomyces sp. CB03234]OKK04690.1 SAM-dependent methyltransferase [Streptomyces sp. CB03234]
MTDITASIAAYWDAAASSFDDEPDHGLRAASTRAAWARLVRRWMPSEPVDVLDIGSGTGSMSLLLAESGHRVTGVDLAPRMVDRARAKFAAAGLAGRFLVGDAMEPPTGEERFGAVLCRHLVWTLPDPEAALRDWVGRLRPGGRLVLIEGRWREADRNGDMPYVTGAETLPWNGGIGAENLAAMVRPLVRGELHIEPLGAEPDLWGGPVADERYALVFDTWAEALESDGDVRAGD